MFKMKKEATNRPARDVQVKSIRKGVGELMVLYSFVRIVCSATNQVFSNCYSNFFLMHHCSQVLTLVCVH